MTEEICLRYFADDADFADGISGIINNLPGGSISAQITPLQTNLGGDATSKNFHYSSLLMVQ